MFNKDFKNSSHQKKEEKKKFLKKKKKELRRWFKVIAGLSFTQLWDLSVGFKNITMNRKEWHVYILEQGFKQSFSGKDHRVNISKFSGHLVSAAATQLCSLETADTYEQHESK